MKNIFLIATKPNRAVNRALMRAFTEAGFQVETLSPEKVTNPKFNAGNEQQAACVLIDCDSKGVPKKPTGLLGELSRISGAFAKNTLVFAYGSDSQVIGIACSGTDTRNLMVTEYNASQTVSLIRTMMNT